MVAYPRPLTYADLVEMPDDGKRREVMGGELIVSPAPNAGHQDVIGNLYLLLRNHIREHGGQVFFAPFDVELGHYDIVQPDLLYLAPARPRVDDEQHVISDAPDLIIEVLSPGTGWIDRTRKMALYATSGVPEYWIVDPMRRLLNVYCLKDEEYVTVQPDADDLVSSPALGGLRIAPEKVFATLR